MQFPVALLHNKGGGFTVTFPDIPEAISEGDTEVEALAHARDALVSALDFYFEDRRPVPSPSRPKRGQKVVELPASLAAKVLLLDDAEQFAHKLPNGKVWLGQEITALRIAAAAKADPSNAAPLDSEGT